MNDSVKTLTTDPQSEYASRRDARRAAATRLGRLLAPLPTLRLVTCAAFVGLTIWGLQADMNLLPAGAALAAFVATVMAHNRLASRRGRARRAADFYNLGLERLADRWQGHGPTGERFADPHHPYCDHLDLFGRGSLFQLLCSAQTPMGERTLAEWLNVPAPPAEIHARHEALDELRGLLDLREDLATLARAPQAHLDERRLAEWSTSPGLRFGLARVLPAAALALAFLAALTAWLVGAVPPAILGLVLAVESLVLFALARRVKEVTGRVAGLSGQLELLEGIFRLIERREFASSRLRTAADKLRQGGLLPSREIRRLQRWLHLHESLTENKVALPLAIGLLTPVFTTALLERWRIRVGACVGGWLEALGEFEALMSLAGYAFEHPRDTLPVLAEGGAVFDGRGLGHPLLPQATCVTNDVRLDAQTRALLISGSNMSGKSTLLRTVGVSAVMALAGAPVRAGELTLSPLAIGACINVHDSLQEGQSHFYAEMARLRDIALVPQDGPPLLFLFDEIMHGTNSHDRRIGTEAVLRRLLDRGAIGIVTTHDLALAEMEQTLRGRMTNAHFEDQVEGGRMTFDYKMKPGVVTKSNALEIMRSLGMDV